MFGSPMFIGSGHNSVEESNGFYISYNPYTDQGEETALVMNGSYYILLGDYRKDYKTSKNKTAAKRKFNLLVKQGAKKSPWSN